MTSNEANMITLRGVVGSVLAEGGWEEQIFEPLVGCEETGGGRERDEYDGADSLIQTA